MNLQRTEDSASRFARFVEKLTSVIGHADRERPLNDYCCGLLVSEGRRSVEPIAAVTAPSEVPAQHQRLLHFVANAPWSDAAVLGKVRELILPVIERHGPIGLSTIRLFRSADPNQSACSISIAASLASKRIVRWQ